MEKRTGMEHTKERKLQRPPLKEMKLQRLPLKYLQDITDNFSSARKIGEGGFGVVYKGIEVESGVVIAVKKLRPNLGQQDKQFKNEANHLARVNHHNVVKLIGYCDETKKVALYDENQQKFIVADEMHEKLLCYEYLSNGSLDSIIFDESLGFDWQSRYKIIVGICQGLHYLHEGLDNTPIIHMDLKPSNILLDDMMEPKIADFGLSRLFSDEQSLTCTKTVMGSIGYMAPEYIQRGEISTKSDIYSLGILILEIITGKKNFQSKGNKSGEHFIEDVRKNWTQISQIASKHPSLEEDCLQQVHRCIKIGLCCVEPDKERRPSAGQMLSLILSAGGRTFQIYVRMMRTIPLDVKSTDTIDQIKCQIGALVGIDNSQQSLFFAGKHLEEDNSLADYKIMTNSYVDLYVSDGMEVSVIIPSVGKTMKLSLTKSQSVVDVKAVIKLRAGIPLDEQILMYGCQKLEDNMLLSQCGLRNGHTLHVLVCPTDRLNISVDLDGSRIVVLDTKCWYTVADVKLIIETLEGLPASSQILMHNQPGGTKAELKDTKTLKNQHITNNDTLTLYQKVHFFVKTYEGRTLTMSMRTCDTTEEIMKMIKEKLHIKNSDIYFLHYRGRVLSPGDTLRKHKLENNSTVDVRLRTSHRHTKALEPTP